MVKNGNDFKIQHPQCTQKQLKHFRPYAKKFFLLTCVIIEQMWKKFTIRDQLTNTSKSKEILTQRVIDRENVWILK